jgi:hypothetical protein
VTTTAEPEGTSTTTAQSDRPMTVARRHTPNPRTPPSQFTTKPSGDTGSDKRTPITMREQWARIWPSLLAVVTLSAVGGPAAVASYRHARDVITHHGDPIMAPWLALTTDGMPASPPHATR